MIRSQQVLVAALALAASATHAQPAATIGVGRSAAYITDPRSQDVAQNADRAAALAHAEAALARGDTATALDSFERAAMMLHAPDTEMGLVRTYMQAGQYRRALAFCAHTAGGHLESAGAGALYAWLLKMGGHAAVAQQVIDETVQRAPTDRVALGVWQAFAAASPQASGVLLDTPHRMAPQPAMLDATAPTLPATARVVSSGVLVDRGRRALIPSSVLEASSASSIWIRNGLGHTTPAVADPGPQLLTAWGVTVMLLSITLDSGSAPDSPPRQPFAGSPGTVVEYAESTHADAAWPQSRRGFLGPFAGMTELRRLGIEVPRGTHGGPVFDALGRVVGMALGGRDQEPLMLPATTWATTLPRGEIAAALPMAPDLTHTGAAQPASPDETYESALRLALQVIRVP